MLEITDRYGGVVRVRMLPYDQEPLSLKMPGGGRLSVELTLRGQGAFATGAAAGVATVQGVGAALVSAAGLSGGAAAAVGAGTALVSGAGAAAGESTVSGGAAAIAAAAGAAAGVATVSGSSGDILAAAGSAAGQATVSGIGASIAAAVGSAAGVATAAGASVAGIAPILSFDSFTAGSGGSPDQVAISWTYSGADDLDLYLATGALADFAITKPQLVAGSGGDGVEFSSVLDIAAGTIDLSGFTDDTVAELAGVLIERNNGGTSDIERIALTSLDFTAPTVSTVATNEAGDEITITFSEALIGTNDAANFTMSGHTLSGMAGTGTTRTLSVSPAVANGDVDTLAYSGGNLTDERGNALVDFSGQAITNNVPASGPDAPTYQGSAVMGSISASGGSETYTGFIPAAGTYILPIAIRSGASGELMTPSGPNITSATKLIDVTDMSSRGIAVWLVEASAASNLVLTNTGLGTVFSGRVYRILADGYTATGHVEGGADGVEPSTPNASVTLGSAAAVGDAIVSIAMFRDANATSIAWGDDATGNEVAEELGAASDRSSVALGVADSATAYTASAVPSGDDGAYTWVAAIVALKAA